MESFVSWYESSDRGRLPFRIGRCVSAIFARKPRVFKDRHSVSEKIAEQLIQEYQMSSLDSGTVTKDAESLVGSGFSISNGARQLSSKYLISLGRAREIMQEVVDARKARLQNES